MIRTNTSFGTVIVIPFLLLVTILTCTALDFSQTDSLALCALFGNACFFGYMIHRSLKKLAFSIELILWTFMFFFMFYAPLIQYTQNKWPWRGRLDHRDVIVASLVCLLFCVCFCIGKQLYNTFSKDSKQPPTVEQMANGFLYAPLSFSPTMKAVVVGVSVILAAIFLARNGFSGVVVSRAEAVNPFYSGGSSAILLIVNLCIPAFLAYGAAVLAQDMMAKKPKGAILFLIQLACLLICNFPTAIPRYRMACIYAPLAMVLFPRMKKKAAFFWPFVLAIFFVLPFLSRLRHSLDFGAALLELRDNFIGAYIRVDYDAFRILSGTIDYVGKSGPVWGWQLLGTLLFFIPSSIWVGKPGGSGSFVIRALLGNDAFSNVSCPLVAEGYINFGIVGVIVFALFFGFLAKKLDTRYWRIAEERGPNFSPYMYLVMMVFFMLRGDLMSSFAYLMAFMVIGYAMRFGSRLLDWKRE